jgi:hypothetical protein
LGVDVGRQWAIKLGNMGQRLNARNTFWFRWFPKLCGQVKNLHK